ncbi:MAG: tRNA (adenosine(37)-N6)-threonylcarbamoyltransferase complex dimerization subunit type 1 TsaB [Acidimicrobiales bacterium]
MIVLGIESATESVGAAVGDGVRVLASLARNGRRRHAERLAPAIASVLGSASAPLSQLDAIAVDVGPGLFTGLRVGVATAKGLSQGLGVGILGLSSLEVLAAAALAGGWDGPVLAVVDGRRGEVFAGRYEAGPDGTPRELAGPDRFGPESLGALVGGGRVLACGDGARRYRDQLPGAVIAPEPLDFPDPAVLVSVAMRRLAAGTPTLDATAVAPVYLREADARINWVQRDPVPAREAR